MTVKLPDRDAFLACLQTTFRVLNVLPEPIDLELVQVTNLMETPRQIGFSVIFLGPADRMMPQHIYRLQHPQLGEMDLFLVPVGKQQSGYEYEAVFNHLKPPSGG